MKNIETIRRNLQVDVEVDDDDDIECEACMVPADAGDITDCRAEVTLKLISFPELNSRSQKKSFSFSIRFEFNFLSVYDTTLY